MHKIIKFLIVTLLIFTLTACSVGVPAAATASTTGISANTVPVQTTNAAASSGADSAAAVLAENSATHEAAADYVYDAAAVIPIGLKGDSITANNAGVTVVGSKATITAAGTYSISGTLTDGQIIVNTKAKEVVRLILNGVDIHSLTSASIYIVAAQKTVIMLADNTKNTLTDGKTYIFAVPAEEEPNATLFSKSDLTLYGSGSLTVNGNFQDGITSKDGLIIASGTITVNAVDDGIRGKDYLVVKDGNITVNAQGDGLKSDNESDASKGYISIERGVIQVTATGDAIHAQTDVIITDGTFTITSGGGSNKTAPANTSAKGIKAVTAVRVDGGTFNINSADDGVHTNGSMVINGGTFIIATGDDGMHADAALTVNGGDIRITKSYEGIESSVITINAGNIHILASDDGVNVAGGKDSSGTNMAMPQGGRAGPGGGPGQDTFNYTGSTYLYIHGGYLVVNANGDGIDVNGAIEMTAGVVLVSGPIEQMNGALDYDASFKMSGGSVAAAGSSGMAMAPSQTSSQLSVLIYFTATQPAGTLVHIQNSAGEDILTFAPTKAFQSLAFSSSKLIKGMTYTVFTGGKSSGSMMDNYYQGGTYAQGTQYTSFTISATVTTVGTGGRGGMRQQP